MGILLSRFKKKKETTFQILESLDNRIKKIEDFSRDTEQRQRTVVGQLILYSVGLYVIAALIFYFYSFPKNVRDRILCVLPLLVFPIIVLLLKRLVQWYYHRKITYNQELLSELKDEKRLMLENVKDNETYKVAKQILEKFAPDQLRKPMTVMTPMRRPGLPSTPMSPSSGAMVPSSGAMGPSSGAVGPPGAGGTPHTEGDLRRRIIAPYDSSSPSPAARSPMAAPFSPQRLSMPRPIIPADRSFLDKVVEYLVGDGPSNRYALLCKHCHSHNGMALREEFEYLAFQCCYCMTWNPARKQRPLAPRLPSLTDQEALSAADADSASDTTEESDADQLSGTESQQPEAGLETREPAQPIGDKLPASEPAQPIGEDVRSEKLAAGDL